MKKKSFIGSANEYFDHFNQNQKKYFECGQQNKAVLKLRVQTLLHDLRKWWLTFELQGKKLTFLKDYG